MIFSSRNFWFVDVEFLAIYEERKDRPMPAVRSIWFLFSHFHSLLPFSFSCKLAINKQNTSNSKQNRWNCQAFCLIFLRNNDNLLLNE